jgi:hypothetical protein
MNHAIIIHGWGATSQDNWFPWLKKELEEKGWKVDSPDFPNTQWPKLTEWLEFFDNNSTVDNPSNTILIGHSLGVPFILRYLEKNWILRSAQNNGLSITASYLVSGFHKPLGYPATENFVDKPFDWKTIRKACEKFIVINSDNDPYIPRTISKELAFNLGVDEILEKNGEHLNAPEGYLTFPKLRDLILAK